MEDNNNNKPTSEEIERARKYIQREVNPIQLQELEMANDMGITFVDPELYEEDN